jgi:hypothetical protein
MIGKLIRGGLWRLRATECVAVIAVIGCSGGPAPAAPSHVSSCGALNWPSSDCAACTDQSCCQVADWCGAVASCAPLSQCMDACGDAGTSCETACALRYNDAISNYNAILNCQSSYCAASCTR